jgi:hypothetical protein
MTTRTPYYMALSVLLLVAPAAGAASNKTSTASNTTTTVSNTTATTGTKSVTSNQTTKTSRKETTRTRRTEPPQTKPTYPKLATTSAKKKAEARKKGILTDEEIAAFTTEWHDTTRKKRTRFHTEVCPITSRQRPPAGSARILVTARLTELDLKKDKLKDLDGKLYLYITDLEGNVLVKKDSRRVSEMKKPKDNRITSGYLVTLKKQPIVIVVWTKYQKKTFGKQMIVDLNQIK